ncbi:MAG: WecB/TagA/CpsF family glycosyltransferase [Leptolyngbyaceae bacterium]|nr:WecB/TagA/CpsF family glycosyltransferase [Leptolyngbyaceae bacterium]
MITQMAEETQQQKTTSYVLGLPLHRLDNYAQWLEQQVAQQQGGHVVTLNAEMAMQADHDPALADVIRAAELVVPDGAGVVFYMLLRGQKIQRCPGIELAESLIRWAGTTALAPSLFFYGGKPGVAEAAAQQWQERYPGVAIAGIQHGYLQPEDEATFCQTLQTANPAIIFVGLGVPRQEFWITQHRHLCPNAIWVGVGGSFDIWAGVKDRAPQWLRNNSLEWTYRLYQEPWRWRRMLALPKFAWRALWER